MVKLIAMIGYIPISLQAYDIRTLTHFICFATPQKTRRFSSKSLFYCSLRKRCSFNLNNTKIEGSDMDKVVQLSGRIKLI